MKTIKGMAVIGALLALTALQTSAQNVTLNATFALTALTDSGRMAINNRTILNAINTDLGGSNFTRRAVLQVLLNTGGASNAAPTFVVSDGTNLTDISNFLTVTPVAPDTEVTARGTTYSIEEFKLITTQLSFDIQGLTAVNLNHFVSHGNDFGQVPSIVRASAAGFGTTSDGNAVVSGTINASGRRVH